MKMTTLCVAALPLRARNTLFGLDIRGADEEEFASTCLPRPSVSRSLFANAVTTPALAMKASQPSL